MSEKVDCVVIGAGVVGLAVARAAARAGRDVILIEKNAHFGEETSSRNSEVIHAGIYYRPGGWRARLAVKGRDTLYSFCKEYGVQHRRCGKLIVAERTDDRPRLAALIDTAGKNGVDDLTIIDGDAAREMEPGLACALAIHSPSSGIVNSHELMTALLGDFEDAGGVIAYDAPVLRGQAIGGGLSLEIGGDDPVALRAKTVVNCAGLWADRVARSIVGIPGATIPHLRYGKGQYFSYLGKAPFQRLIYPLPTPDSQGVHYTLDLGGQGKLGPDLAFVESNNDYDVDPARRSDFAAAARKFWPDIDEQKLQPGYAGIRPKTRGPGEEGDFVFSGIGRHGVPGYLGLYGIESPGLTTCLAIADAAVEMLLR